MRRVASACAVSVVMLSIGFAGVAIAKGPPLTKNEYVAQYNALCEASSVKAQAAIYALGQKHTSAQFVAAIAPIYQARLDKTRKLVPPKKDRKRVQALLAAEQAAVKKAKDDNNTESIGAGAVTGKTTKVDRLAQAYGLESGDCLDVGGGNRPCPGGPCAGQAGGALSPGGSGSLPAGQQWVTAVCAAETTLHDTLQREMDAIKSRPDAASQKKGFVEFLSGLPAQIKTLERAVNQAGVPGVMNGDQIAKTYIDTLNALIDKVPSLKSMAEALPTSSPGALQTAGKAIGDAIDTIKRKGDDEVTALDTTGAIAGNLAHCGGIFPL